MSYLLQGYSEPTQRIMYVENHIKTYTSKTVSSHFFVNSDKNWMPQAHTVNIQTYFRTKSERPSCLKSPSRCLLFTMVEHTKLKPYLAKIPRTNCLWCDKNILEMRPPKTINIKRKNRLRFPKPSMSYKKSTGKASVRQSWSKSWLSIVELWKPES